METKLPATIHHVPTPSFLVDIDVVKRNCQRMIDRCQKLGVELRPHMKTHKTIEAGVMMTGETKRKIVVSTLDEANFYADQGFDDILYASPMVPAKLHRCKDLANKLESFHLFVDTELIVDTMISTPLETGKKWSVFLEVDCGYGRTGAVWDSDVAVSVAKKANEADNVVFQGLYFHCGNTYIQDPAEKVKVQKLNTERLISLKDRLLAAGVVCKTFGCGSTPSCSQPIDGMAELSEFHPGNYVFYDYMQVLLESCKMEDVAGRVVTMVIDHKPEVNQLAVDAGFAALSTDGLKERFECPLGIAPAVGHPELILKSMTQELGKFQPKEGKLDFSKYPLGSRLYLLPWHSCATAMMFPEYYVHSGDKIVGMWRPTRGW